MKNKFISLAAPFFILSLISLNCKEGLPTPPLALNDGNYFVIENGSQAKYKIDILNSSSIYDSIGFHKVYFTGDTTIKNTKYQVRADSIFTSLGNSTGKSFVRQTEKGVYSFVDTTGLTSFIPDTIKNLLTIDPEQILFSYPVQIGREWICYSVSLPGLSIVDFRAAMIKKENISFHVNGVSNTSETIKIDYTLKLNIIGVDSSLISQEYNGSGWFAIDFGLVKYEGAQEILTAISSAVYQLSGDSVNVRLLKIE